MLALTALQTLLTFLFCLVCVLLILLILIQKGRGGGLSGAFGGVGSYSPFGTKTGDALTWATVVLTGMFLLIAVLANYVYRPQKLTGLGASPTPAAVTPIDAGEAGEGALPATPGSSAVVPPPVGNPAAPPVQTQVETEAPADAGAAAPAPAPAETPAPVTATPAPATQP